MTTALATRQSLRATFERVDTVSDLEGRPHLRALLKCVTDPDGQPVAPHAWVAWGEQMDRLCLQPGDAIAFKAEVIPGRRAVTLRQPRGMVKL